MLRALWYGACMAIGLYVCAIGISIGLQMLFSNGLGGGTPGG